MESRSCFFTSQKLDNRTVTGSEYEEIENRNENIVKNPHIAELSEDILYHFSLSTSTHNLREMFGDVKFVCVGGTTKRMADFAQYMTYELNYKLPPGTALYDISGNSYRFSMYKVGPVLCVSHGMGIPSISILLHELIKLLHYSECQNITILRLGTCGGIGVGGGTLIISNSVVDGLMRPYQEAIVLGTKIKREAILDRKLAADLLKLAKIELSEYPSCIGTTMCTDDFYEGQARLDGAFCNYTQKEKLEYLQNLSKMGIVNMEMESLAFAAMCTNAGISGAVICVALLDRLKGDQIIASKETLQEWQLRPQKLAALYIKNKMEMLRKH